jgi:hypothetical protein
MLSIERDQFETFQHLIASGAAMDAVDKVLMTAYANKGH